MGDMTCVWDATEAQMTGEAQGPEEAARQGASLVDGRLGQIERASGESWSVVATPALAQGSDTGAVAADSMGSLVRGMGGRLLGLTEGDQGLVATMGRGQRVEAWDIDVIPTQQVTSMAQVPTANLMGNVMKMGQGSSKASGSLDVTSEQEAKGTLSNAANKAGEVAMGFARGAGGGSMTTATTERHESHMGMTGQESWCASWGPIDGIPQPYTQGQCTVAHDLAGGSSSISNVSRDLGLRTSLSEGSEYVAETTTVGSIVQEAHKVAMTL